MTDDPRKTCAFCQHALTWSPDRGWVVLGARVGERTFCPKNNHTGPHTPYDLPKDLDPETVERWLSS